MLRKSIALLWLVSSIAIADPAATLQSRLSKLSAFQADFSQQVFDQQGKRLQEAKGDLRLARPNRFSWHTVTPDESSIIADGKDVWIYDPFVEQVTVMPLAQAVNNTPFALLSSTDSQLWQKYRVEQKGERFEVSSVDKSAQIAAFALTFDAKGILTLIEVNEQNGPRSEIRLSGQNLQPKVDAKTFKFELPEGVELDDQRPK